MKLSKKNKRGVVRKMKYIRTKDGRIFSLNEFNYEKKYHWYRPNEKHLSRLNIDFSCWCWCFDDEYDLIPEVLGKTMIERLDKNECKFADTIEELCDEFVVENPEKDIHERFCDLQDVFDYLTDQEIPIGIKHFDEKRYLISGEHDWKVFGAIWTDKGLIYVAKMNNEGDLELL